MGPLYQRKQIKLGFVVVCPTPNPGLLKTTLNSLRCNYWDRSLIVVVPKDLEGIDFGDVTIVPGGNSIISQINTGIDKSYCKEWNMIVQAGTWVRSMLDAKFSYFISSERDILFPVMDRKTNFVDAAWGGLLIHKKAVKDLGSFPENNPEEFCKLLWATDALEKGYRFKGIVGASLR